MTPLAFPDLPAARLLQELRGALLADEGSWAGCGHTWQAQLDACVQGKGSCSLLLLVWDELRGSINAWRGGRSRGAAMTAAQLQAGVARAVAAMQAASRSGDEDALLQVPLESILCGDLQALQAVRRAIEVERRVLAARLAAGGRGEGGGGGHSGGASSPPPWPPTDAAGKPPESYFARISAPWAEAEFDSGAETEMEEGSDVTDLDEAFD